MTSELITQVKAYAHEHSGEGGRDVVTTLSDDEITSTLYMEDAPGDGYAKQCATLDEVVSKSVLAVCVSLWATDDA